MTPPATPNETYEDVLAASLPPPVFHNFLRAFYPFHPTYALTDSSVTLPLDEGDIVLVHSIHTNGWADGTLLLSGARGWLPTNYCEAYEPDEMCNLLKALLNFWDLLRSTSVDDTEMFGNQEFMKGLIAGVRYLLERTNCLNRESTIIQRSDMLRKCRKSLLSELSSLVKTAKRLLEGQRGTLDPPEDVNDIVDEMILKAFRIVTKGVRFLDVLEEDRRARAPPCVTVMATVAEESYVAEESNIPPTPPAEQTSFQESKDETGSETDSKTTAESVATGLTTSDSGDVASAFPLPGNKRLSAITSPASSASHRLSLTSQGNRLSSGISHRLSLTGPVTYTQTENLISERLNRSHDKLLSYLGAFIGRLHLGSQSRSELSSSVKQSASSGGELLTVIDAICVHSNPCPESLEFSRDFMLDRLQNLVQCGRDTLVDVATEDDVIMPSENTILLDSATGCVRAAGECVAMAKLSIERTGDFELEGELQRADLGVDLAVLDIAAEARASLTSSTPLDADQNDGQISESAVSSEAVQPSHTESVRSSHSSSTYSRRGTVVAVDKPLPDVPEVTTPTQEEQPMSSPEVSRPSSFSQEEMPQRETVASISSTRPSLPPLPKLSTSLLTPELGSPTDETANDSDFHSSRFDSLVASSAGSSATYLSRDSEASMVSQTSTRATTPDHTLQPREQPSISDLSSTTGSSAPTEEVDDVESRILEKTFAHELMFNKEGQVTAGSLPALVERLTAHESTPDAVFVSTFYLTFRLFCTPIKLTEALIDRFEYVGESASIANPVRLRVYNIFKGWLESHWRDATDRDALKLILPFAEHRLGAVLPSAGRRLLQLIQRAVEITGSSRLASSMGKTNTALAPYVPAETPIPQPAISKSQLNMLNAFKCGGPVPAVLDFEPIELARQLTINQMSIFCSIMPEELLASQWMKNGGVNAPNVKAMSSFSTDLSNLVADTILHYGEIKKRAAAIKQWIKVAHQCLELHNYDGLMAIVCSLNSSTISRLRKTWDLLSTKRKDMLRNLQEIVEPSQNNKILRTLLHDHVPPCLPFLGMYLTDLTFVDIGNPCTKQMSVGADDRKAGGLTVINFDKHTRTAKIIGELQRFQIPYRLTEVPEMQHWMTTQIRRVRDGDQGNVQVSYYRRSLLLEPRETQASRAAAAEPPATPITGAGGSRDNLFAWMSRDRNNSSSAPSAQV